MHVAVFVTKLPPLLQRQEFIAMAVSPPHPDDAAAV
jgi:hypothetical protein